MSWREEVPGWAVINLPRLRSTGDDSETGAAFANEHPTPLASFMGSRCLKTSTYPTFLSLDSPDLEVTSFSGLQNIEDPFSLDEEEMGQNSAEEDDDVDLQAGSSVNNGTSHSASAPGFSCQIAGCGKVFRRQCDLT